MKIKLLIIACLCFGLSSLSQTYLQPAVGLQSTYSGGCPISTCSGTYYDDGGLSGNYSNNVGQIYQVICPSSPGKCLQVTFNSFNVQGLSLLGGLRDGLSIGNGPAQNSTVFTTAPANGSGWIYGTPSTPFSYTANNSSGCLTFRFLSNGSGNQSGWAATLSCVTCAAAQPAGNSDCSAPTQICSNAALTDNSSGPGINAGDGCSGCVTGETYSNWYIFSPTTSGSLSLAINPNVSTDDLDFAIYGPGASCGSLGTPIRCSYAMGTGSTGMSGGSGDNSEDVNGDSWVNPVNVTAGQVYYLLINNWTAGGSGYGLNFTGSTASLNCTPLPIELISFKGEAMDTYNTLSWKTASESNNDFYTLERSIDGTMWSKVSKVPGSKNSDFELSYSINDEEFVPNVINYYRLSQTDFNGKTSDLRTISLINDAKTVTIIHITNFLGQEVNSDYDGLRIIQYSDGTVVKKVGN
ncbi:MAG: hypothetical protein ABI207_06945 [Crocinitomicaceae bacterium]